MRVGANANVKKLRARIAPGVWRRAAAGDTVLLPPEELEGSAGGARAVAIFDAPPEDVWSVLTGFESWPEFMPLIRRTSVRRESDAVLVEQHYRVMMVGLEHTTRYDLERGQGRIRWSLDTSKPHDIADTRGSWRLLPIRDGRRTLVTYEAKMDAGRSLPGFVQDFLQRRSLGEMFRSLRSEVARRKRERPDVAVGASPDDPGD